ncbi:MAG: hypothetical protein AMXMBFR12_03530 [Candidatus Babeliales bacterium]
MKFVKLKYAFIFIGLLAGIVLCIFLLNKNRKYTISDYPSANAMLLNAAALGNLENAETALAHGAEVNTTNEQHWTSLHMATFHCHENMVRFLLSKGANVNAVNDSGMTPLEWAVGCDNDNEQMVKLLLDKGAEVNIEHESGHTPLLEAISRGKEKVVKLLLDHGANVNAQKKENGETALHLAVAYPYPKIVKLLLEHGADETIKDAKGKAPHISHVLEILESQGEKVNRPIND